MIVMIADERGHIDYDEAGTGPTVVLVPGSCSTGAAWRPVMAGWNNEFRCVTTSLLGYGGTAERRTTQDADIAHEAEALEEVVRTAGGRVHLVGHSFGGLVGLAVALRGKVPLASLTIAEAPAIWLLQARGEETHLHAFQRMSDAYFTAFKDGELEAISKMIDFYAGEGTFSSWPPRVRAYAVETTPVNILDWQSAFGFQLTPAILSAVDIPVLVIRGGDSHHAIQRANEMITESVKSAELVTIRGATHFMIATHAGEFGKIVARHMHRTYAR